MLLDDYVDSKVIVSVWNYEYQVCMGGIQLQIFKNKDDADSYAEKVKQELYTIIIDIL